MSIDKALYPVPAIFALLLAACSGTAPPPTAALDGQEEPAAAAEEPTDADVSAPSETPHLIPPAWMSEFAPLGAAAQEVEIPTSDGRTLAGIYYPAKVNPAPIVVLMHWAGGDMTDWQAIAPWLQNRRDGLSFKAGLARPALQVDGPWLDPSWFPHILPEASFGVLVFDYNSFGQSAGSPAADALLLDSVAAVQFASALDGADPDMIMAAGASIGGDGAVDGCYLFNQMVAGGDAQGQCIGALSLSPGNYLTGTCTGDCPSEFFSYADAVAALSEAEHPVYCLTSQGDESFMPTCTVTSGDLFKQFIYSGDDHGMFLVDPALTPSEPAIDANALDLLLDLLSTAIGLPITP